MQWGFPGWRTYVEQLASFARLVLYDKRGTGLSDPVDGVPTLESRVDDLAAVMNAAGSQRAALFGFSEVVRSACCSPPPIRSGSMR
jgi:pimeloyl-ACP methyl ester carboxylesterase